MKDLIERLQNDTLDDISDTALEVADALERLTAGDVEMPKPTIEFMSGHREPVGIYDADDIKDYGDQRAAAAVLAERERCADVIERQSRALHEIAEEWAGSECGVPLYASEAYAIGLAKRMYALAVEGLTPHEHLCHDSDCAVHNMPAYPNGPCDCGLSHSIQNQRNQHDLD